MTTIGEQPPLSQQLIDLWKRQIAAGWTCRRCSNGDHKNCELEQRGMFCTCQEGECGVA